MNVELAETEDVLVAAALSIERWRSALDELAKQ
jgi:hypothetical protein